MELENFKFRITREAIRDLNGLLGSLSDLSDTLGLTGNEDIMVEFRDRRGFNERPIVIIYDLYAGLSDFPTGEEAAGIRDYSYEDLIDAGIEDGKAIRKLIEKDYIEKVDPDGEFLLAVNGIFTFQDKPSPKYILIRDKIPMDSLPGIGEQWEPVLRLLDKEFKYSIIKNYKEICHKNEDHCKTNLEFGFKGLRTLIFKKLGIL
ncbi:MAG: hypothetical protein CL596_05160 [Alteromonas sp.]|nr:hypothetical protein [Alteromonas sp.]|tara:strand:- start:16061 stop:16672 length:612 start_codon:yes stop_codon:yes gene_type:complete